MVTIDKLIPTFCPYTAMERSHRQQTRWIKHHRSCDGLLFCRPALGCFSFVLMYLAELQLYTCSFSGVFQTWLQVISLCLCCPVWMHRFCAPLHMAPRFCSAATCLINSLHPQHSPLTLEHSFTHAQTSVCLFLCCLSTLGACTLACKL